MAHLPTQPAGQTRRPPPHHPSITLCPPPRVPASGHALGPIDSSSLVVRPPSHHPIYLSSTGVLASRSDARPWTPPPTFPSPRTPYLRSLERIRAHHHDGAGPDHGAVYRVSCAPGRSWGVMPPSIVCLLSSIYLPPGCSTDLALVGWGPSAPPPPPSLFLSLTSRPSLFCLSSRLLYHLCVMLYPYLPEHLLLWPRYVCRARRPFVSRRSSLPDTEPTGLPYQARNAE